MKNDVLSHSSMINKYVCVNTVESVSYQGFVDAIDPITQSVILSAKCDEELKTTLILGHTISNIEIKDPPSGCEQYVAQADRWDAADVVDKKNQVHKWLLRNLLPVQDVDGVLQVHGGYLVIKPPYRTEDCYSSNTIILGRVQHLLSNIPNDLAN